MCPLPPNARSQPNPTQLAPKVAHHLMSEMEITSKLFPRTILKRPHPIYGRRATKRRIHVFVEEPEEEHPDLDVPCSTDSLDIDSSLGFPSSQSLDDDAFVKIEDED